MSATAPAPVPCGRRPRAGEQEAEPGLLLRLAGREHVGRADLEDGHVGPPLALVLRQDADEARQQRAAQLAVVGRDGVGDPDRGGVVPRPAQSGMVIRADEGVRHDLRQAAPAEQVAHAIDAPARIRPVRRHGGGRQLAGDRLVAADACHLLREVGLDHQVAAVGGDGRHQCLRRAGAVQGHLQAGRDRHAIAGRRGLGGHLDTAQERGLLRRRERDAQQPAHAAGPERDAPQRRLHGDRSR